MNYYVYGLGAGFLRRNFMKYSFTYRRALCLFLAAVGCVLIALPALAQSQSGFWGRLTWDTVMGGEGETRFRYGNWYGPGWWGGSELDNRVGGLPPIDALDAVAQKHDFGYEIAETLGKGNKRLEAHYKALADIIAVRDTLALSPDPTRWNPPARDPGLARKYRERIALGFPNYQQRLNQLKAKVPSRIDPSHPAALDLLVDGKPPLDDRKLEELIKNRVRSWNADYAKRKAKEERQSYAKMSDRGSPSTTTSAVASNVKGKQYAWIFKRVVEDNGRARAEQGNKKPDWKAEVSYSKSGASLKMTYLGPTNNAYKIPHVKGSSISIKMGWSAPPNIIHADKEVSLKLAVALGAKSHKWPDINGKIHSQIVAIGKDGKTSGAEIGKFYNDVKGKPRAYWFETSSTNNYQTFDETVYAKIRSGTKPGSLIGVRVSASMGSSAAVSTLYIYEWADIKTAERGRSTEAETALLKP
jgi:hypothetical protein